MHASAQPVPRVRRIDLIKICLLCYRTRCMECGPGGLANMVPTPALQHRDTVDQRRILPCCHCCCCPAATAASPLLLPGRLALPPLLSLHSSSDLSDVGLHAGCPVPVVSASGCSCRRRLLRWRAEYRGQGLVPRHRRRHQTGR